MNIRALVLIAALFSLAGCGRDDAPSPATAEPVMPPPVQTVRFATYNTSLFNDTDGGLIGRLQAGDANANRIAAVIQHLRPDVILLNEFDYDSAQQAADLFQRKYLDVSQAGQSPMRYDYRYTAPVNTGEPSGLDIDGDGKTDTPNDAWGFGKHPGQYGLLVLSRYKIDALAVRSFQKFLWSNLPDAQRSTLPDTGASYYADAVWPQLRLSSKSHWDIPIETPGGTVHFLVAHPTPPVFDGPDDHNGARNFDEIRLFAEYLSPGDKPWLCDDAGHCGGLAADTRFVIAGDMNADPIDGDGKPGAIRQLLDHPRVDASFVPRSAGAANTAAGYGIARKGDVATHTGDYGPKTGTLRLDYVLPSRGITVRDGGVFWPADDAQQRDWVTASDHRSVWLDLEIPPAQ